MLVQAHGAYGSDNSYVLDALRVAPERLVGVVIVDPADPDPAARARARRRARLRRRAALRHRSSRRHGSTGRPAPRSGRPRSTSASASWRRCSRPSCPASTRCWRGIPGVPVVLDHCGFPDLHGRAGVPGPAVARARRAPGPAPQGHLARARGREVRHGGRVRNELVASSAPTGSSGVPTTRRPTTAPYAALVALGRDACAGPAADQARFLGGNASGSGRLSSTGVRRPE